MARSSRFWGVSNRNSASTESNVVLPASFGANLSPRATAFISSRNDTRLESWNASRAISFRYFDDLERDAVFRKHTFDLIEKIIKC